MSLLSKSITGCALWILTLSAPVLAAEPSIGQQQYEVRCAMCHGPNGRGNGWLAEHLIQRVPSLTQMKKSNGGVFPFERTYEMIDGRAEVRMHGPRTMPIWGNVYRATADEAYRSDPWRIPMGEAMIRAQVLALIEYISGLQE